MDILYLREIRCPCSIGVNEWEKSIQQTLVLDLELAMNFSESATTDNLAHTLDYQELSQQIINRVADKHFNLIEAVAYDIADWIEQQYKVSWLRLRCDKGNAVGSVKNVGVIVERGSR